MKHKISIIFFSAVAILIFTAQTPSAFAYMEQGALLKKTQKASSKNKKKLVPELKDSNWREKAASELENQPESVAKSKSSATPSGTSGANSAASVATENLAPIIAVSPATVVTKSETVETPVVYSGLQIGITAQPYRPQGRVSVIGQDSYDASLLGTSMMTGLTLRWLPWEIEDFGNPGLGFSVSGDYLRQSVRLRGESGADLGRTYLQSMQLAGAVNAEWVLPQAPRWTLGAELAMGRLDLVQSSVSTVANTSDRAWYFAPGVSSKYRVGDFWLALSYMRRNQITTSSPTAVNISENGVIMSLLYGLR